MIDILITAAIIITTYTTIYILTRKKKTDYQREIDKLRRKQ